ncbi:MAG: hypothetical protein ACRDVM_05665 [Acidimicrobiia bacterium]
MKCPQCRAADVIEIKQKLPDGTEVQFFSCHRCEERWWDHEGRQIDLRQVLELARRAGDSGAGRMGRAGDS